MKRKTPLEYSSLNAELIDRFPQLFGGYAELKAMGDGDEPGPHVLYGDVLVPEIARLLGSEGEEATLVRIFAFLEELATSSDQAIRDVLGASVLEPLNGNRLAREAAKHYMGPSTRQMAKQIENAWGS